MRGLSRSGQERHDEKLTANRASPTLPRGVPLEGVTQSNPNLPGGDEAVIMSWNVLRAFWTELPNMAQL